MNILYIGDVMAEPGIKVVEQVLPSLRKKEGVALVIAQAENVSDGKSMSPVDMRRLQKAGVDFFTGGNHTPSKQEIIPLLEDPYQPVIGPANMVNCPGPGYKYIETPSGKVLIVSLLGQIVGNSQPETTNPLQVINKILQEQASTKHVLTIIDFHGDYSSEKVIISYYLDGQVTAVVGDHWHVPSADAEVLPKGTARIADVGMCGSLDSSLGVKFDSVIPRWLDGQQTRNEIEEGGRMQFNALLIEADPQSGLAKSAKHIRQVF